MQKCAFPSALGVIIIQYGYNNLFPFLLICLFYFERFFNAVVLLKCELFWIEAQALFCEEMKVTNQRQADEIFYLTIISN